MTRIPIHVDLIQTNLAVPNRGPLPYFLPGLKPIPILHRVVPALSFTEFTPSSKDDLKAAVEECREIRE